MTLRLRTPTRASVLVALAGALLIGAVQQSFLCDDAFITFRYVSNARDGFGLVWNPPPFRPVEGYSSFLWTVSLWAAWSWFGVEPPSAANVISILCGLALFVVTAVAAMRVRDRSGRPPADLAVCCALAVLVGNRTFLQWMTGGLGTSTFNLAFVVWVVLGFRARQHRTAGWLFGWSAAAAAAALARPDGLLPVGATAAVALMSLLTKERRARSTILALAPLLAVAAHLLWHRWFYGEYLPNTYYAKVSTPWPEAGLRYFACFLLEHGFWIVLVFGIIWAGFELRRGAGAVRALVLTNLPAAGGSVAVLAHVAYYTLIVGGDHFEYRVYSQLLPLGMLACLAMASRIGMTGAGTCAVVLAVGIGSGVGWLQAFATRDMPDRGFRALADHTPDWCKPLAHWYDRQQAYLRVRLIGIRCSEHARFLDSQPMRWSGRRRLATPEEPFPVVAPSSVGLLGWCLPDTVVIDTLGLNDWVVARTPPPPRDPAPLAAVLRATFDQCDLDGGGALDEAEVRAAVASLSGGKGPVDDMTRLVMASLCWRNGEIHREEFARLAETLFVVRMMAHERLPPDGYVEGLRPNVGFVGGEVRATPRRVPLTVEAIRAFELDWRQRAERSLAERR